MMRGKFNWAVAVREPSGDVYVEEHDLASGKNVDGWLHWPLVRGCRALVESLLLGFKALEIAALHAFAEEDDEGHDVAAAPSPSSGAVADKPAFSWKDDFGRPDTVMDALGAQTSLQVVSEPADPASDAGAPAGPGALTTQDAGAPAAADRSEKKSFLDEEAEFGKKEMAVSMVLGLVLGVVLFIVAPAFLTNLIVGEYDSNALLWNIVDGLLRVAVFVFYLWLIGRMQDIKRMFGYHGAEHKTIHCYEHGLPLTPENARSFPRLHVRCGTAFLIMVMIIAIFVYTVVPLNALIDAWGVPDGAPKLRARHSGAHRAHAGHRRHLLRDHRQVGRQPSGKPPGEGHPLARYADAVPDHERTRRQHDRMRHRRHAARAGARRGGRRARACRSRRRCRSGRGHVARGRVDAAAPTARAARGLASARPARTMRSWPTSPFGRGEF